MLGSDPADQLIMGSSSRSRAWPIALFSRSTRWRWERLVLGAPLVSELVELVEVITDPGDALGGQAERAAVG